MIYEIVGWLGTISILLAYFFVSTQRVAPSSRTYQFLNLFGAVGIMINAVVHSALPSVGLNIIWFLIALYGLIKSVRK